MKWVLFGLMVATVPVLYYMLVIAGFMPLIAIVALSFRGPSNALASLPPAWKLAGFASVSAALVAVAFLPVYGVGHHEAQGSNLYRFVRILLVQGF